MSGRNVVGLTMYSQIQPPGMGQFECIFTPPTCLRSDQKTAIMPSPSRISIDPTTLDESIELIWMFDLLVVGMRIMG